MSAYCAQCLHFSEHFFNKQCLSNMSAVHSLSLNSWALAFDFWFWPVDVLDVIQATCSTGWTWLNLQKFVHFLNKFHIFGCFAWKYSFDPWWVKSICTGTNTIFPKSQVDLAIMVGNPRAWHAPGSNLTKRHIATLLLENSSCEVSSWSMLGFWPFILTLHMEICLNF